MMLVEKTFFLLRPFLTFYLMIKKIHKRVNGVSELNLHLSNQCRILYPMVGFYLHSQTLQINLGFFIALVACVNYSPKWVDFVGKNFINYKKLAILVV